ncbi:MAG: 16S rRNA (cytidine(1402)-2'-O)-methyltransferase [bacterium]
MLYIIATPIGNLEDISLRALRILKEVDFIACEDTRQTQKLCNAYNIQGKLISYHQHSSRKKTDFILEKLEENKSVAVVSDGGTPGISDPGCAIVRSAVDRGLPFTQLPGPSALIGALILSGFSTDGFLFLGFLPRKHGKIRKVLESSKMLNKTTIFYESPFRIKKTLQILREIFDDTLKVSIARELTKKFEEILRGPLEFVVEEIKNKELKGECTVVFSQE